MAANLQEWLEELAEHRAEHAKGEPADDGPRDTPRKPWGHTAAYSAAERAYEAQVYGP